MHSTIDITKQPSSTKLLPVYNCVKYGFQCNDYRLSTGTNSNFTVEMSPLETGYNDPGAYILLAGQQFNMGTVNTYNEVNSAPTITPAQFATNLKAALEKNSYLFGLYTFQVLGTVLLASSRDVGEVPNFDFDIVGFTTQIEPTITNANGTNAVTRTNYNLQNQIWICDNNDNFSSRFTTENYTPQSNGAFEINIGAKVAPLVSTTPYPVLGDLNRFVFDENVINNIALRYGELYSEDIDECGITAREFDNTDCVLVLNAALDRSEQDKIERPFLTSMPQLQPMCEDTPHYLWVNRPYLAEQIAPNTISSIDIKYIINYTDGTQSIFNSAATLAFPAGKNERDGLFAVACEYDKFFKVSATPGKTVFSWGVALRVTDNTAAVTEFDAHLFKLQSCCDPSAEFYFLNEFGGFDTMLFTQLNTLSIGVENSLFDEFSDCEQVDTFETGQQLTNINASRSYVVNSKFVRKYDSEQWIEQFLKSPVKYARLQTGDRVLIKRLTDAASTDTVYNEDDNTITLTVEFSDNELLNVQNN